MYPSRKLRRKTHILHSPLPHFYINGSIPYCCSTPWFFHQTIYLGALSRSIHKRFFLFWLHHNSSLFPIYYSQHFCQVISLYLRSEFLPSVVKIALMFIPWHPSNSPAFSLTGWFVPECTSVGSARSSPPRWAVWSKYLPSQARRPRARVTSSGNREPGK